MIYMWFTGINYYKLAVENLDRDSIFTTITTILKPDLMDHLHYRLNFDLDKSRQKFHHSLKEPHKISNIPKFRCEML